METWRDGSRQAQERLPCLLFPLQQQHKGSFVYLKADTFKLILWANTSIKGMWTQAHVSEGPEFTKRLWSICRVSPVQERGRWGRLAARRPL